MAVIAAAIRESYNPRTGTRKNPAWVCALLEFLGFAPEDVTADILRAVLAAPPRLSHGWQRASLSPLWESVIAAVHRSLE